MSWCLVSNTARLEPKWAGKPRYMRRLQVMATKDYARLAA